MGVSDSGPHADAGIYVVERRQCAEGVTTDVAGGNESEFSQNDKDRAVRTTRAENRRTDLHRFQVFGCGRRQSKAGADSFRCEFSLEPVIGSFVHLNPKSANLLLQEWIEFFHDGDRPVIRGETGDQVFRQRVAHSELED